MIEYFHVDCFPLRKKVLNCHNLCKHLCSCHSKWIRMICCCLTCNLDLLWHREMTLWRHTLYLQVIHAHIQSTCYLLNCLFGFGRYICLMFQFLFWIVIKVRWTHRNNKQNEIFSILSKLIAFVFNWIRLRLLNFLYILHCIVFHNNLRYFAVPRPYDTKYTLYLRTDTITMMNKQLNPLYRIHFYNPQRVIFPFRMKNQNYKNGHNKKCQWWMCRLVLVRNLQTIKWTENPKIFFNEKE